MVTRADSPEASKDRLREKKIFYRYQLLSGLNKSPLHIITSNRLLAGTCVSAFAIRTIK